MVFEVVLERYREKAPFAAMLRAALEHLFQPQRLDELFECSAVEQYTRHLTFSALTELFCEVVLRVRPSVRKAYQSAGLPVTLRAVYDKLAHVETATAEALVRQLAGDVASLMSAWPQSLRPDPVAGLRLRTVDGNFLAGTDHRLGELRGSGAAALPGMSVVLRDEVVLACAYLRRWRLETSFQELTVLLRCEVDTLAYPKAALFGFALALTAYNVFALLQAAVAAEHGREKAEEGLSPHAVVEEVSSVKRGMELGLPQEAWEPFARMSGEEFAAWLRQTAARIDWRRYQKSKRAPKKPVKVKRTQRGAHRSTARLLAQRTKQ